MEAAPGIYSLLGRVLTYPDPDYRGWVEQCRARLATTDPEAARRIERFSDETRGLVLVRLQELYTQTFDLNPVCSLEVGWQLYGEEYTRGSFLVTVRQQMRRHGVPESVELPDHLTNVLPLLDALEENEVRAFSLTYLIPALKKMLPAFEGKNCPYAHILLALDGVLRLRYGSAVVESAGDESPRRFETGEPIWNPNDLVQISTDSQRGLK